MTEWDRRDVLMAGGVATTFATLPATLSSAPSHIVIGDTRFAASRTLAARTAKSGARIVWTDGDITDFWRDELDLLWRHRKVSLSGLTTGATLFYLERLAMDRGLRVVFRQEVRQEFGARSLIAWRIATKRAGVAA